MNAIETRAVHAGRRDLAGLGVHVPSIDLSTTNPLADVESGGDSYEALATGGRPIPGGSHVYGRLWNPTVARFEEALAELEAVSYTHLRAHETRHDLVCRLLLEKKKKAT